MGLLCDAFDQREDRRIRVRVCEHDPAQGTSGAGQVPPDDHHRIEGRILSAPYLNLQDPARAVREVEWCLDRGAKVIVMRSGPVRGPGINRTPGDPVYDAFWARINEAGILVAYHSGDSGYGRLAAD